MATVNQIIAMLRKRQEEHLRAGVMIPRGKEAFDFGVVSGTCLAYEQMIVDIQTMIEQEKEDEKRRESSK